MTATESKALTKRELQIATLIGEGATVVQVARAIACPLSTVRVHVRAIARKLPNPHGLPAARLIRRWHSAR
ncbi:MAG: hypothetical protein C0503_00805 [Gemmatimonas sp.]|nr:hypothetical protein [Gemmatimonas sp.]